MAIDRSTFLGRLARDKRGNTIAIMAAMLIPMTALAGSAIDAARLYVVKVRLQQACDAGVLAGRKFMTSTGSTLDQTATDRANAFFLNNFATGWMATTNTTFVPAKASVSEVSGVATTTVPMTLMKIFGFNSSTLSATCQARYDVADTDILFVLDTTGSMACQPADSDAVCSAYVGAAGNNSYTRPLGSGVSGYAGSTAFSVPEKSGSRIDALRQAVVSFYNAFDTAKDPSTKVRYGFVTYTSSVNAGKAIQDVYPNGLVGSVTGDTASYQSRHVKADYTISYSDAANTKTQAQCTAATTVRVPAAALTYDPSDGQADQTSYYWNTSNGGKCYTRTSTLGPTYEYMQLPWDVSGVVAGNAVTNPTKVHGQLMRWLGCVETKVDTAGQTSFSATNPPSEINPDAFPSGASRWIPQMQDLEYIRNGDYDNTATAQSDGEQGYYVKVNGVNKWISLYYGSDPWATALNGSTRVTSDADYFQKSGQVACGKPIKRLGEMSQSDVYNWVHAADFVPIGGTYHDTGMIWGARLLSSTGPWAADTSAWTGHKAPNRVIVFLTDGDMAPSYASYTMYGEEGYDRRVTTNQDYLNQTTYTNIHNQRFLGACAAAKAHNIDIWTVSIDTTPAANAALTPVQQCATKTAQALFTTSGTDLGTLFADIAKRLAMLRLNK